MDRFGKLQQWARKKLLSRSLNSIQVAEAKFYTCRWRLERTHSFAISTERYMKQFVEATARVVFFFSGLRLLLTHCTSMFCVRFDHWAWPELCKSFCESFRIAKRQFLRNKHYQYWCCRCIWYSGRLVLQNTRNVLHAMFKLRSVVAASRPALKSGVWIAASFERWRGLLRCCCTYHLMMPSGRKCLAPAAFFPGIVLNERAVGSKIGKCVKYWCMCLARIVEIEIFEQKEGSAFAASF